MNKVDSSEFVFPSIVEDFDFALQSIGKVLNFALPPFSKGLPQPFHYLVRALIFAL